MGVYVIRFEDKDGNYHEYRRRKDGSGMESRSNLVSDWFPSIIKDYDEARSVFSGYSNYREVFFRYEGLPEEYKVTVITNPVPEPLHRCYCNWDKVYREGCSCGGL